MDILIVIVMTVFMSLIILTVVAYCDGSETFIDLMQDKLLCSYLSRWQKAKTKGVFWDELKCFKKMLNNSLFRDDLSRKLYEDKKIEYLNDKGVSTSPEYFYFLNVLKLKDVDTEAMWKITENISFFNKKEQKLIESVNKYVEKKYVNFLKERKLIEI